MLRESKRISISPSRMKRLWKLAKKLVDLSEGSFERRKMHRESTFLGCSLCEFYLRCNSPPRRFALSLTCWFVIKVRSARSTSTIDKAPTLCSVPVVLQREEMANVSDEMWKSASFCKVQWKMCVYWTWIETLPGSCQWTQWLKLTRISTEKNAVKTFIVELKTENDCQSG